MTMFETLDFPYSLTHDKAIGEVSPQASSQQLRSEEQK